MRTFQFCFAKVRRKHWAGNLLSNASFLAIRKYGVLVPLRVNEMGHYVLSVVKFGKGSPCIDRGPNLAASYFNWLFAERRLPLVEGGLLCFVPPKDYSACTAATLGDARGDCISDPKKIIMKLHIS